VLQSTSENWLPTFVTDVAHLVYKKLQLKNLSIYLNSTDKLVYNDKTSNLPSASQLAELLLSQIPKENNPQGHSYILTPTSAELKVRPDRNTFILWD